MPRRRTSRDHSGFVAALRRVAAFLALRGAALAGAVAALAAIAAIATYSVNDPSFNTATPLAPDNALGAPGAYVADLLLQWLGVSVLFALASAAFWSGHYAIRGADPERKWSAAARWVLFAPTIALIATFASMLPIPATWPFVSGLGGVIGDALLYAMSGVVSASGEPYTEYVAGGVAFVIAAPCFGFLMGVRLWHLSAGYDAAIDLGYRAGAATLDAYDWVRDALRAAPFRRAPADGPAFDGEYEDDEADDDFIVERAAPADAEDRARRRPRRVVRKKKAAKKSTRESREAQPTFEFSPDEDYQFPPLRLLAKSEPHEAYQVNDEALEENARMLENVLGDFGVRGEIINVRPGPVVTLYELEPAAGVKSSRVIGLADDIARSMSAVAARVAVIPGRNVIGIELPNIDRETVYLRELLSSPSYENTPTELLLALGKSIGGEPVVADLARMPHLLIAGTTGSGKSVGINSMILSLLYRLSPDRCKLILIDPKMLELSVYDGIPHLLAPVVTDPRKAVVALKWTVREMEERYKKMSKLGVRNIAGFNTRLAEAEDKGETPSRTVHVGYDPDTGEPIYETEELDYEPLPFIVVVIDEMADLMMVAGKDIEAAVQRLAQMARAAGIHLIMATQRPSVDVITGTIKANFPTRISFQVTSKIDSRTILGEQGAEQLLGQGDMLHMAGGGRITRVHGPFVADDEVEHIVRFLKKQGKPDYVQDVTEMDVDGAGGGEDGYFGGNTSSGDSLFDQAVAIVARDRKASTSYIQRRLQIGYNRAATLIERMEEEGLIGPANHAGKREIFLPEAAE